MKKVTFLTIISALSIFSIPFPTKAVPRINNDDMNSSLKESVIKYCNEKDKGTPEMRSLRKAKARFLDSLSEKSGVHALVISNTMRKQDIWMDYWGFFNERVEVECPEYKGD